jgi:hypothetical protein
MCLDSRTVWYKDTRLQSLLAGGDRVGISVNQVTCAVRSWSSLALWSHTKCENCLSAVYSSGRGTSTADDG